MTGLKRQLGLSAVVAVVMGNMVGSGIFFTPGELARVASSTWQVYFIWTLCGLVVLCGALTLAELTSQVPQAGATYHIMTEAYGPLAGFVKVWMEVWVSAPGSIAGVAIVFGEFAVRFTRTDAAAVRIWGISAIILFAAINLAGVRWGGRAQVVLTSAKVTGILLLVGGSFLFADPVVAAQDGESLGLWALLRFVGLGVAAVFFTYDGWVDVSHVAGEVDEPSRTLPLGLGAGVLGVTLLYLVVNHAFLRIMPLAVMREHGATVATSLAETTFGGASGSVVSGLIMVSIAGALGGLVMTAPRLVYATARSLGPRGAILGALSRVSDRTGVPGSAIVFSALLAITAVLFFQTFDRLVSFILVPLQIANVFVVAAVFRFRARSGADAYRAPGYPVLPLIFIVVMTALMVNAAVYNPKDTLLGLALTLAGVPVYGLVARGTRER